MTTLYQGGVFLYNDKPVYILSGDYQRDGRISNYWWWKEILEDGTLGPEQKGYDNQGKFKKYDGAFEVEIKVMLKPNEKQPTLFCSNCCGTGYDKGTKCNCQEG